MRTNQNQARYCRSVTIESDQTTPTTVPMKLIGWSATLVSLRRESCDLKMSFHRLEQNRIKQNKNGKKKKKNNQTNSCFSQHGSCCWFQNWTAALHENKMTLSPAIIMPFSRPSKNIIFLIKLCVCFSTSKMNPVSSLEALSVWQDRLTYSVADTLNGKYAHVRYLSPVLVLVSSLTLTI